MAQMTCDEGVSLQSLPRRGSTTEISKTRPSEKDRKLILFSLRQLVPDQNGNESSIFLQQSR